MKYWLGWTFFDKTYQTEKITSNQLQEGPQPVKDIIQIKCSLILFLKLLHDENYLRIFLCNEGNIIACAEISLLEYQELPIVINDWLILKPIKKVSNQITNESIASVKLCVFRMSWRFPHLVGIWRSTLSGRSKLPYELSN